MLISKRCVWESCSQYTWIAEWSEYHCWYVYKI
jgi:hypothetical protein